MTNITESGRLIHFSDEQFVMVQGMLGASLENKNTVRDVMVREGYSDEEIERIMITINEIKKKFEIPEGK